MIGIFSIFLLINLLTLASLRWAKRKFSLYEITVNLFFIASLTHLSFSAVSLNMERIKFVETQIVFWILEMDRLVFMPCMYIWILFLWFQQGLRYTQKVVMTLWWVTFMSGMEQVHHMLGLTQYDRWNTGYSLLENALIVCLAIPFSVWFRGVLRKEGKLVC